MVALPFIKPLHPSGLRSRKPSDVSRAKQAGGSTTLPAGLDFIEKLFQFQGSNKDFLYMQLVYFILIYSSSRESMHRGARD